MARMDLNAWLDIPGNSQTALAERMSAIGRPVTQGAISQWLKKGRVPAERVPQIAEATDYQVTEHDLRPDLYKRRDHPISSTQPQL
jgi:DNA-binding transcriptional regulator YdaS (Cro superfamily)